MNKIQNLEIRTRPWRERFRSTFSLYPDFGPVIDLADNFRSDNDIYAFRWKCKTWDKICREANRITYKAILKTLQPMGATKVTYDHKLGCSCGCSSGYRVYGEGQEFYEKLRNHDGYGKIVIEQSIVDAFKKKLETVYKPMFEEECKQKLMEIKD